MGIHPAKGFLGLSVLNRCWGTGQTHIAAHFIMPLPDDLDLWPLTLKLVRIIARGVDNLYTNFGVSIGRLVLDLWANTCQTYHVTLRPWPLTLEVTALTADAVLRATSIYQVWSSYAFPFGRHWAFTVWALIGLVTLTFYPLSSKSVHGLLVWYASILPNLGFLGLSVLYWCWGTWHTDGRTGRHRRPFYSAPSLRAGA